MASRPKTPDTPAALPSFDTMGSQLEAIRSELQSLNRLMERLIDAITERGAGEGAAEYAAGRDRDPGDAVPPGVAVQGSVPLEPGDEAALHRLEGLPKRASRRGRPG